MPEGHTILSILQGAGIIAALFWFGYSYRILKECSYQVAATQKDLKQVRDKQAKREGEIKDHIDSAITMCSANRVPHEAIAIVETKLENVIFNQAKLEVALKNLSDEFRSFTRHYYESNGKNRA